MDKQTISRVSPAAANIPSWRAFPGAAAGAYIPSYRWACIFCFVAHRRARAVEIRMLTVEVLDNPAMPMPDE